jgi:acyl-homoserine lactone acylase PvdQ
MACQQLRSTSLPVRPHALVQELEDELQRLRSGAAASAPSPSPSPAALAGQLGDVYGRIEELVGLPGGRDALSSARWRGAGEAALDASVAVLDLCERARDAAASAKQHARAARRALRRGDAAAVARAAVRGYVRCLAKAGKQAAGAKKLVSRRAPQADAVAAPAAVRVLSEAVSVTVAVLQRAMASLSARAVDTRRSRRWSAVSRLLGGERSLGVCGDLDGEDGATIAQETLQELEDSVEAVESGLEHLFRRIVQSRVALLNVLTL